jgi:agmatine deiminase
MIRDNETNFLFLADCLQKKNPVFCNEFVQLLVNNNVKYSYLPDTKDIWAVDYMPVQIDKNSFINFVYNPDYLQTKSGVKSISNVHEILRNIAITAVDSDIVLDGGNVIKGKDEVILCDKVFKENPNYKEINLIKKLQETFQVNKVIFLPTQRNDFTGHADGLVRYVNDKTVLINQYADNDRVFRLAIKLALHNAGLDVIELPYNPYQNLSNDHAYGIYINYLEMDKVIVVPTFNIAEDIKAIKLIEGLFPAKTIVTINSNEIAKKGGILNCISWNIKT